MLTQKADEYAGSSMEVEMLCMAATVYGRQLKNMEKLKEYADRVASINPGEPKLNSLYQMVDIKYDPNQYTDKFNPEIMELYQNKETQPEEEIVVEDKTPEVSIAPNPANPRTTIRYSLPEASNIRLDVYSINGQKVSTLVNGFTPAGNYNVIFDGSRFGSGIYLYRFNTDNYIKTGKILMLK